MSSFHLGILRSASWFVPRAQRAEWLAEWRSELWQLQNRKTAATVFCLGSFRDAAWLWRNHPGPVGERGAWLESPAHCLVLLASVAVLSLFFALRLPDIPLTREAARLAPRPPRFMFPMIISLACVILPAATSFSLGEYQASRYLLRRWIFFAAKVLLILPIVYAGCVWIYYQDLSHQRFQIPVQALLVGCILAFRWVLNDQRRRCPQCLRLLGNAAHVGQPARNFLEWNGTELMCARGHGLLYIPATPADWSPKQRWLSLDPSWNSLF